MFSIEEEIDDIVTYYDNVVKHVYDNAKAEEAAIGRSTGGFLRANKGKLVEDLATKMISIAWKILEAKSERLDVNSQKHAIPLQEEYINSLSNEDLKKYIRDNIKKYVYKLNVDRQIYIDGNFVLAIECKAFAEIAMLKRVLMDFYLLKTVFPDISCYLFQLESQLGGDYFSLANAYGKVIFGSTSAHTIQSYFPNVDLNIHTFVKGERKIDRPIHKYYKPIEKDAIRYAIEILATDLKRFV